MAVDYNALAKQFGATSSVHPVGGQVDYNALAAQYGEAPAAPSTPVAPPIEPSPTMGRSHVENGQSPSMSRVLSNIKAIPGQIYDAAKTLLSGNTGEELAAGLGAGRASQNNLDQVNQEAKNLQLAIQARNKLNAAGHDTTHADQMIADMIKGGLGQGSTVADVLPHSQDTNTEALLNVATVAGNVLGAGTYSKGLSTGVLATAKPTVIAAPQALSAKLAQNAATKPFDSALARIVPDYAASTPAQKSKLITETVAGAPRINEGGLLKGRTVNPTKLEQEAATQLVSVPGYSAKATNLETYATVENAIATRAQLLKTSLKSEGVLAPRREIVSVVSKAVSAVPKDSLILQNSDPVIQNYLRVAKNAADQADGTLAGVLDVRKTMDAAYVNARGKLAFDSDKAVALDEVHNASRDALNQYLIDHAVSTDVKAALRAQWNLYRARDAMLPKAVKEGVSTLDRAKHMIRAHPLGAVITSGAAAIGADKILKATTGAGI